MNNLKRTHNCSELTAKDLEKSVVLKGWVNSRRDHGGLIFIDLRDRFGLTQIVLNPQMNEEAHKVGEEIRGEYVICVEGAVEKRPEGTVNAKLTTGEIEIKASRVTILNRA